jgi:hypothetical protein
MNSKSLFFLSSLLTLINTHLYPGNYQGFEVAVYARAYEVRDMENIERLDSIWMLISSQVKVDKIYLETYRDKILVDKKTIEKAKNYFREKGLKVAGGITYTINESNRFETFCYSNPEHRRKTKEIAELTAKLFDEFILDDFFFTSCKCELCIEAKGDLSWTEYRIKLMTEAAEYLVIKPAKKINPDVMVVIKYPNWYEHFQALGFNLEDEPELFDGIYTGTETRDPVMTRQHLQQYESYLIFRYFENIKPGGNRGGWVDPGGLYYMDRYAEQLWLTLFAKAPEITLFDFRQLQKPFKASDRAAWQTGNTSFNYDEMIKPVNGKIPSTIARTAGYSFELAEKFITKLGRPVGIQSYKPFHSYGEDFLQNYFGMIGIPMDILPQFPAESKMILLTESAKFDQEIVDKIKRQLSGGKNVMITTGLLKALNGKGIEDIVELNLSDRRASVKEFVIGRNEIYKSKDEMLIPQIGYFTNDSWEDISTLDSGIGWPILHQAKYGNGYLFVLTIPDNFADLYNMPPEILNRIRQVISENFQIRLEGSSQVALFVYDNDTFIIESFLPESTTIKIITSSRTNELTDFLTNEKISGVQQVSAPVWGRGKEEESSFEITIAPHSFRVFQYK